MKLIALRLITGLAFILAGCNPAGNKETEFTAAAKDTVPAKDFSHVVFAIKKDTSCGMPLSAGVEDTLHFKGKVYGFCSKECKNAFVAQLKTEKKL